MTSTTSRSSGSCGPALGAPFGSSGEDYHHNLEMPKQSRLDLHYYMLTVVDLNIIYHFSHYYVDHIIYHFYIHYIDYIIFHIYEYYSKMQKKSVSIPAMR